MSLGRSIWRILTVSTIAAGFALPVMAETVDLSIIPNTSADALTASLISGSQMDVIVFSEHDLTATGVLTLAITDGRGTDDGWNVSLQVGDFLPSAEEGTMIPAIGFRVISNQGIHVDIGDADGIDVVNTGASLEQGSLILHAAEGAGTGRFVQRIGVELDIPAWQPAGTYTSEMTLTVAAGPGS